MTQNGWQQEGLQLLSSRGPFIKEKKVRRDVLASRERQEMREDNKRSSA